MPIFSPYYGISISIFQSWWLGCQFPSFFLFFVFGRRWRGCSWDTIDLISDLIIYLLMTKSTKDFFFPSYLDGIVKICH